MPKSKALEPTLRNVPFWSLALSRLPLILLTTLLFPKILNSPPFKRICDVLLKLTPSFADNDKIEFEPLLTVIPESVKVIEPSEMICVSPELVIVACLAVKLVFARIVSFTEDISLVVVLDVPVRASFPPLIVTTLAFIAESANMVIVEPAFWIYLSKYICPETH